MFGLIAALTPVLYKHVSDRRQDIENINEANTLLLLKEQTKAYIDENKDTLLVGTTIVEPVDIGSDIDGYKIGIRKDSDGSINAMIAANAGGNDMKAAKVASLLGVSAGIYSAQDSAKAWGINGVWAENISNYGFTSLPTGVPVLTTTYDEEDSLDMDKIFSAIEEHKFDTLTTNVLKADEVCIFNKDTNKYDCRDNWDDDPIKIIEECNKGDLASCVTGRNKAYNHNCQAIIDTYKSKGQTPPNQHYVLTISASSTTTSKEYCWFADDFGFSTNEILVTKCKVGSGTYNKNACVVGFKDEVNKSCQNVYDALALSELTIPASGSYSLTSDAVGNARTRTCYFDNANKKGYEGYQIIDGCNAGTVGTCAMGYNNSLNRTCQQVIDVYKAADKTPLNGDFRLTTSATTQTLTGCWFVNTTGMSTAEVISGCNSSNATACQLGYDNRLNRTCAELKNSMQTYGTTPVNGSYKLTFSSVNGANYDCDMSRIPAWTKLLSLTTDGQTYKIPYSGSYGLAAAGGGGGWAWGYRNSCHHKGGNGGMVSGYTDMNKDAVLILALRAGGGGGSTNYSNWTGATGGSGVGVYKTSTASMGNLLVVAGGGGAGSGVGGGGGGGGYGGGGGGAGGWDGNIAAGGGGAGGTGFASNGTAGGNSCNGCSSGACGVGSDGGGNGGGMAAGVGVQALAGSPYGGDFAAAHGGWGGGGGSGRCIISGCAATLPYGISQKTPTETCVKSPTAPEAAIYLIEMD